MSCTFQDFSVKIITHLHSPLQSTTYLQIYSFVKDNCLSILFQWHKLIICVNVLLPCKETLHNLYYSAVIVFPNNKNKNA